MNRNLKPLSVYIAPDLLSLIQQYAKQERRSLSEAVVILVEKALKEFKK